MKKTVAVWVGFIALFQFPLRGQCPDRYPPSLMSQLKSKTARSTTRPDSLAEAIANLRSAGRSLEQGIQDCEAQVRVSREWIRGAREGTLRDIAANMGPNSVQYRDCQELILAAEDAVLITQYTGDVLKCLLRQQRGGRSAGPPDASNSDANRGDTRDFSDSSTADKLLKFPGKEKKDKEPGVPNVVFNCDTPRSLTLKEEESVKSGLHWSQPMELEVGGTASASLLDAEQRVLADIAITWHSVSDVPWGNGVVEKKGSFTIKLTNQSHCSVDLHAKVVEAGGRGRTIIDETRWGYWTGFNMPASGKTFTHSEDITLPGDINDSLLFVPIQEMNMISMCGTCDKEAGKRTAFLDDEAEEDKAPEEKKQNPSVPNVLFICDAPRSLTPAEEEAVKSGLRWSSSGGAFGPGDTMSASLMDGEQRVLAEMSITWHGIQEIPAETKSGVSRKYGSFAMTLTNRSNCSVSFRAKVVETGGRRRTIIDEFTWFSWVNLKTPGRGATSTITQEIELPNDIHENLALAPLQEMGMVFMCGTCDKVPDKK